MTSKWKIHSALEAPLHRFRRLEVKDGELYWKVGTRCVGGKLAGTRTYVKVEGTMYKRDEVIMRLTEQSHGGKRAKPPLGIIPHTMWVDNRRADVMAALTRYAEAGVPAPVVWVQELELLDTVRGVPK